jgi:phage shock protein A
MNPLGAVWRYVKSFLYLITGQIDKSRKALDSNPNVMRAKFDDIIKGKVEQIHTYKQAVATLIAQQEKKMAKVKSLTEEVQKLENLKAGALAMAKQAVAKLQGEGKTKEDVHADADYKKCLTAYNDFAATLEEKKDHIKDLEGDIAEYDDSIANHKINLQQLQRDIEKLKSEAADAVADVITAKEERDLSDMLNGISKDGMAKELQDMRDLRHEMRAEARVSREMAGTDSKAQESQFLEYARSNTATDEFDALLGVAEGTEGAETAASEPEQVEKTSSNSILPE